MPSTAAPQVAEELVERHGAPASLALARRAMADRGAVAIASAQRHRAAPVASRPRTGGRRRAAQVALGPRPLRELVDARALLRWPRRHAAAGPLERGDALSGASTRARSSSSSSSARVAPTRSPPPQNSPRERRARSRCPRTAAGSPAGGRTRPTASRALRLARGRRCCCAPAAALRARCRPSSRRRRVAEPQPRDMVERASGVRARADDARVGRKRPRRRGRRQGAFSAASRRARRRARAAQAATARAGDAAAATAGALGRSRRVRQRCASAAPQSARPALRADARRARAAAPRAASRGNAVERLLVCSSPLSARAASFDAPSLPSAPTRQGEGRQVTRSTCRLPIARSVAHGDARSRAPCANAVARRVTTASAMPSVTHGSCVAARRGVVRRRRPGASAAACRRRWSAPTP